jgi:hypothetical protein
VPKLQMVKSNVHSKKSKRPDTLEIPLSHTNLIQRTHNKSFRTNKWLLCPVGDMVSQCDPTL